MQDRGIVESVHVGHDLGVVRGVVAGQHLDVAGGTSEPTDATFEFDDTLQVFLDKEAMQPRRRIPPSFEVLADHEYGRPGLFIRVHARSSEAVDEYQVAGLAIAVLENWYPTT
jgi:hypothetical protein